MMEYSDFLSYDKIRDIIYKICRDVEKEENINFDVYPVTCVEYYKSDLFKKRINLFKSSISKNHEIIMQPFNNLGVFFENTNNVVIFVNHFKKRINVDNNYKTIKLVSTVYHELRHVIQNRILDDLDKDLKINMAKFRFSIDSCRHNDSQDYGKHHDEYSQEIDADAYAFKKAKEYFSKHNRDIYYYDIDFFREIDFYNQCRMIMYDVQLSINVVDNLLKDKDNLFLLDDNFILRIFYNEETGEHKDLSQIMKDPEFNNLDYEIIANMLSSKGFLKSVDFSKLSSEELDYLFGCIEYVYNDYCVREGILNAKVEEQSNYVKNRFKDKEIVGKDDKYLLDLHDKHMYKLNRMRRNNKYYEYLGNLLDEYKYHGKKDSGERKK